MPFMDDGVCVSQCGNFMYVPPGTSTCVWCECNGFSDACDADGTCLACSGNTTGANCQNCIAGWERANSINLSLPCTEPESSYTAPQSNDNHLSPLLALTILAAFFLRRRMLNNQPAVLKNQMSLEMYNDFKSNGGPQDEVIATTMLNTVPGGIALPGYLLLDYAKDVRVEKEMVLASGGEGHLKFGALMNPELRQKHKDCADSIVIKEIKDNSADGEKRFHQEMAAMSSLSFHPNIVQLIGYCDQPRCLVMPLYEGYFQSFIHGKTQRLYSFTHCY